MLLRQVQVDRGLFQVPIPEQEPNRAQVSTRLQQVCRKAKPQGMRVDVLVFESCANRCLLAGHPEHLGGDRPVRRVPLVAREQPNLRLLLQTSPVGAQLIEQYRTQHNIAVLAALAAADVDHDAFAVDITNLQPGCLGPACAGCI